MRCVGCDAALTERQVAAFALMHEGTFLALGVAPEQLGPGAFHAAPVCAPCFVAPSHRARPLKAHFCLPPALGVALRKAGSSSAIGG